MFENTPTIDLTSKLHRYEAAMLNTQREIGEMKEELAKRARVVAAVGRKAPSVPQDELSPTESVVRPVMVTGEAQDRMNQIGMTVADVENYVGAKPPITLGDVERTLLMIEKGMPPKRRKVRNV